MQLIGILMVEDVFRPYSIFCLKKDFQSYAADRDWIQEGLKVIKGHKISGEYQWNAAT